MILFKIMVVILLFAILGGNDVHPILAISAILTMFADTVLEIMVDMVKLRQIVREELAKILLDRRKEGGPP